MLRMSALRCEETSLIALMSANDPKRTLWALVLIVTHSMCRAFSRAQRLSNPQGHGSGNCHCPRHLIVLQDLGRRSGSLALPNRWHEPPNAIGRAFNPPNWPRWARIFPMLLKFVALFCRSVFAEMRQRRTTSRCHPVSFCRHDRLRAIAPGAGCHWISVSIEMKRRGP